MNNESKGKVYIVGAGIGKIDYLTVKAYSLLTDAEILIYDALVNTELLTLVPKDCVKIDVGKRGGKPSTPQTEINKLLVEYCQKNQIVVRLKSGDPFIFGRTISEIQTLITAKCNWEIIPGISSVMAGPLLAGIPLTDTVLSRCFVVFTGHEINDLEWENIAGIETIVILMGGKNIKEIVEQLIRHKKSINTPIAIIKNAGHEHQEVWTGELSNIVAKVKGISLSPSVIVIGEVVKFREYLLGNNDE